ncbi:retron Ec48 family effector membrane protein [Microbulbifer sp. TRSA007]|uniref:retron Ec48 family effector membrane protein n=1 Tax=Microbulbifer sp. TRSA007 TaxID=3243384 RepID=UPI004039C1F6
MKSFLRIVWATSILTSILVLMSLAYTANSKGLSPSDFCLKSDCIIYFEKMFSGTIQLLKFGTSSIWIFVFIMGVYIALNNYLTSVKATALSGHINNLTMFKNFVEEEIEKYDLLKKKSFDVFKWYRSAFPNSTNGDIAVSKEYKGHINKIIKAIKTTNESISSPKGKYGYRKHQDRIIEAMNPIGIEVPYLPQNDFHEVESELLKLIDSVNHTFTEETTSLSKENRAYI